MNNPVSTRSGHELYPLPEGCTGNRLWRMLDSRTGASMRQYLDTFERRNLVRAATWDRLAARARAHEIVCELTGSGRTVVLLGGAVREAFDWVLRNASLDVVWDERPGSLPPVLIHPTVVQGVTWRQLPHPSGRNLWYNTPANARLAELLLEELYVEYNRRDDNVQADKLA